MNKLKVLFVVADFYQAGAQRFTYEIDCALDKDKFEVSILCFEPESKVLPEWEKHYYEPKHKTLGTKITYLDPFLARRDLKSKIERRIKKVFFKKMPQYIDPAINGFFAGFDLIHWMGEYTLYQKISAANLNKSLIHSMCAKFQDPQLFKFYDASRHYNFLSGFQENERETEYSEFADYDHWYLPILLKIPYQEKKWFFKDTETVRIGIFTRLNIYKPLDPFFYAFQLVLEQLPNAELHIYGNGDPEKEGMNRYLRTLGIRDKVFFRGHQQDIVETAVSEHINLSWFQGYNNNRPAGYAGFDVCSTGTPLICWDFYEKPTNPFNETFPHYKSLNAFVAKSIEIIQNPESANKLSDLQFDEVYRNRDISKHIGNLESAYYQIAERNP